MNPESKTLARITGAAGGTGVAVGADQDWLQILGIIIAAISTIAPILQNILNKRKGPPAILYLLSSILVLSLTGCATAPTAPQRVASAAKIAAYVGTSELLLAHPEMRLKFEIARDTLRVIEESDTVDLATLLAVVNRLPVKELKSERAMIVVTSATILIADYGGALPVEQLGNLKPVARAIREGIELGLGQN